MSKWMSFLDEQNHPVLVDMGGGGIIVTPIVLSDGSSGIDVNGRKLRASFQYLAVMLEAEVVDPR